MRNSDDIEELDYIEEFEDDDEDVSSDLFYLVASEAINGNDDALNLLHKFF